jgi:hypothetical protein
MEIATQSNIQELETEGIVYEESEMALFLAKLSYYSTRDRSTAPVNGNVKSISAQQAEILKSWERIQLSIQMIIARGQRPSQLQKVQLAQYQWRFRILEGLLENQGKSPNI